MPESLIQELNTIHPQSDVNLGHPPENKFIPKNLETMKKERLDPSKPEFPRKISDSPKVWFK